MVKNRDEWLFLASIVTFVLNEVAKCGFKTMAYCNSSFISAVHPNFHMTVRSAKAFLTSRKKQNSF